MNYVQFVRTLSAKAPIFVAFGRPFVHWLRRQLVSESPRLRPKTIQCDYLSLSLLRDGIAFYGKWCDGVVVDYGCGDKPYIPLFPKATKYVGVDFAASGPDDKHLTANGGLPLENAVADVVLSTSVLEHVPDVPFYISECWRVLRPGGKLLLTTHGIWPYHPGSHNEDYYRWTATGLVRTVEAGGGKVLEVSGVGNGWISLAQQLLVMRDPARYQPPTSVSVLRAAGSWLVNVASICALRLYPRGTQSGDIIPISYIVYAVKSDEM